MKMKKFAAFLLCLCAMMALTAGVAFAAGNVEMTVNSYTQTFETVEAALDALNTSDYYTAGDAVAIKLTGPVTETDTVSVYDLNLTVDLNGQVWTLPSVSGSYSLAINSWDRNATLNISNGTITSTCSGTMAIVSSDQSSSRTTTANFTDVDIKATNANGQVIQVGGYGDVGTVNVVFTNCNLSGGVCGLQVISDKATATVDGGTIANTTAGVWGDDYNAPISISAGKLVLNRAKLVKPDSQVTTIWYNYEGSYGTLDLTNCTEIDPDQLNYMISAFRPGGTIPTNKILLPDSLGLVLAGSSDQNFVTTMSNMKTYAVTKAHVVTYNANTGDNSATKVEKVYPGTSYTLASNTFTNGDYDFAGWYDNAACTGNPVTSLTNIQADYTFYAKWTNNVAKVTSGSTEIGRYATLAEAIAVAQSNTGSTVTLLKDVTLEDEITISSGTFTLHLADFDIESTSTSSYEMFTISNANVTIDANSNDSQITKTANYLIKVGANGVLTINKGTFAAQGNIGVHTDKGKIIVYDGVFENRMIDYYEQDGSSIEVYGGTFNEGIIFRNVGVLQGGSFAIMSNYDFHIMLDAGTLDMSSHPDPSGLIVNYNPATETLVIPDGYGYKSAELPTYPVTPDADQYGYDYSAEKVITVTFNTGDGAFTDGSTVYTTTAFDGGKAQFPATDPTQNLYTFAGWADASGNPVTADTLFTSANNSVYAQWTAWTTITVYFDDEYNSTVIFTATGEPGTAVNGAPSDPTGKAYHSFAGYYTDNDGYNPTDYYVNPQFELGEGQAAFPTTFPEYDLTLYAVWEADETYYRIQMLFQTIDESDYVTRAVPGYENPFKVEEQYGEAVRVGDWTDARAHLPNPDPEGFYLVPDPTDPSNTTFPDTTVAPEGGTTLTAYYDRLSYELTVESQNLDETFAEVGTETLKYEELMPTYLPNLTPPTVIPDSNGDNMVKIVKWTESVDSGEQEIADIATYTMPARNVTLRAYWGTDAVPTEQSYGYFAIHYKQNAQGEYVEAEREVLYAAATEVGNQVTADAKTYTGYTLNQTKSTQSATLTKPTESITTLEFYYDLDQYPITYTLDGGTADGNPDTYTVLDSFTLNNPTRAGYTFAGWTGTGITDNATLETAMTVSVPAGSTGAREYTATWDANTDTAYQVMHHFQNADDDNYTVKQTDDLTGTTDTEAAYTPLTGDDITGFNAATEPDPKPTIAGDGTTVVNLYYDRLTYTLTFVLGNGQDDIVRENVRYGATIQMPEDPTWDDEHQFIQWKVGDSTELPTTMPNADLTFTAEWGHDMGVMEKNGAYQVLHYKQNADGTYPTEATETEFPLYGVIGSTVTATQKTYAGFEVDTENSVLSGEVITPTVENNQPVVTTLKVYYKLVNYTISYDLGEGALPAGQSNPTTYTVLDEITLVNPEREGYPFMGWTGTDLTEATTTVTIPAGSTGNRAYTATWAADPSVMEKNYAYQVLSYKENADGTYTEIAEDKQFPLYDKAGATVHAVAKTYTGYALNVGKSTLNAVLEEPKVVDGQMVITTLEIYYDLIEYEITYDLDEGALPEGQTNPTTYTVLDEITLVNPEREGYTFLGWTGTGLTEATTTVTIPAGSTGSRAYTATWAANAGVMEKMGAYQVLHYQQNLDGTYTEVTADKQFPLYAKIGTTVSATANTYTGFALNEEKTVSSATLEEPKVVDEQMVITTLEFYYDRILYTLTFKPQNGEADIVTEVPFGAALTIPADPVYDDHIFLGWTDENGEEAVFPETMPASDLTYIASWKGVPPVFIYPKEMQIITVTEGQQAEMIVRATNEPVYQWYINRNDGLGWVEIEGATEPTYITTPTKLINDGYQYCCKASNNAGESYSMLFLLEVLPYVDLPATGDDSNIGLWLALTAIGLLGIIALTPKRRKQKS